MDTTANNRWPEEVTRDISAYCEPLLTRPVHEITTLDVAAVLKPWKTKPEVARKLYPAIRRVFEYARIRLRDDHGVSMPDNPQLIAQNVDPLNARAASRKAAKPIPTFQDIAQVVIAEAQRKSTNVKVR